ncbi:Glycoside hydrolase, family 24 [uncultured Caudovirales phage]|uniref:Glycoside hydrolase, family 24 n=1 Tax=uncultured Caudovirales phage TaxID=2100421 RepID=A0A6J5KJN5_9CAUD|nr:Glycoside hydrolase, family 24 [uncultured Caudovirales phage]
MTKNQQAFLDLIAHSEIGAALLAVSDNGYNVIVGSTPTKPDLFTSYADHPRKLVHLGEFLQSTAAGRYQILSRYFSIYKQTLGLPDFSPASQDRIALQMIKERKALDDIESGNIELAIKKCSNIWASFPGSLYQQHTNKIDDLIASYVQAGGTVG